jgi:hypothetical protein
VLNPLVNFATGLLTSAQPLVIPIVGIALFIAGVTLAFGNHQHGKVGVAMALAGGAVMLGAQQMAAAIHA